MQILFFLMIPVGILLLFFSIRMVRRNFSGNIILEIPYTQKSATFEIDKSGSYAVWHMGQIFTKAPLDEFRPAITNDSTGDVIKLRSKLFRPNANNGKTARMELFKFSAPAGKYRLELKEGSSISGLENVFIRTLPFKKVDPDKYFIQVRESQPMIVVIAGIALIAIAGVGIILGLVLGILAKSIFNG